MDVRAFDLVANVPLRQSIPHRFFLLVRSLSPVTVRKLSAGALSVVQSEIGRDVESSYAYFPLDPSNDAERWGGFELLSSVNQTVRVAVSDHAGDYKLFAQSVIVELPDGLDDVDDIAVSTPAVEVAAANGNRRTIIVQNVGANPIRVGTADVAANRGTRLVAGGSRTFTTRAAIYAIREGGSDSTVSISEETKT